MAEKKVTFPASWLAEAREAYATYKTDWEREEIEESILTGNPPEPPQDWDDFLIEYHYAELENAVFLGFAGSLPTSFGE